MTGSVIVPNRVGEVPLNPTKFLVTLFSELALHADHSFERRIEVWNAQVEELRKLCDEFVIEDIEDLFGFVVFLLSPRKFGWVITWFCKGFVQLAASGVVVKQLNESAISAGTAEETGDKQIDLRGVGDREKKVGV